MSEGSSARHAPDMGACLAVTADAATTSRSRARCSYSNEFATAKKKRDAEEASASATPPQRSAKRGRVRYLLNECASCVRVPES